MIRLTFLVCGILLAVCQELNSQGDTSSAGSDSAPRQPFPPWESPRGPYGGHGPMGYPPYPGPPPQQGQGGYEQQPPWYNRGYEQQPPAPQQPGPAGAGGPGGAVVEEAGENKGWRHCYVCSGMFPDRECELYPKYVTKGPGKINCTRNYCTVFTRYTPKKHLLEYDSNGKEAPIRSLGPKDYEVTSIARECEDASRGNSCVLDGDDMGLTCYDTCTTSLCNDGIRKPTEEDFESYKKQREAERGITPETSIPKDKKQEPERNENDVMRKPLPRDFNGPPEMTQKDMMQDDDAVMMKDSPMMKEDGNPMMGKSKEMNDMNGPKRKGKPERKIPRPGPNHITKSQEVGETGFSKSNGSTCLYVEHWALLSLFLVCLKLNL